MPVVALALVLALGVAACGGGAASASIAGVPAPSGVSLAASPAPSPAADGPAATATAVPAASDPGAGDGPTASTSAGASTAPGPSGTPGIAPLGAKEDPSLLAVLPAAIDGTPVALESQAFTDAIADAGFAANVAAAAFGVAVSGEDLASAVVARPVAGVYSNTWFRDWRDTYDEGACAQSGGVATTAEALLGGRTVYIATCAGGLRTYHTRLDGRGLIVSAFSVGDGRFGEKLMAALRP